MISQVYVEDVHYSPLLNTHVSTKTEEISPPRRVPNEETAMSSRIAEKPSSNAL